MILDAFLQFDATTGFSFNQAAATYTSLNQLDLHIVSPSLPVLAANQGIRDIGVGDDPALKLLVQVTTTCTSGGGATLQVSLQGAPDNGSGAPGTFVNWWLSPAYALATLVQGARLYDMDMPRPPAGVQVPRFLQLQYIIGTAAGTGGAIRSFIVLDRHDQMYNATSNAVLGGYIPGIVIAN